MSMSAREEYLKTNPTIQAVVTSSAIVSGVSITGKVPDGFKEVKCSCCNKTVMKIDSSSVSGICFRCVAKSMNPDSIILTDLSDEEYKEFIQSKRKIWKIQEQLS